MRPHPVIFGAIYAAVSVLIEAAVIVVGRLKVPDDNAILAPVVLIVPPVLAAWIGGYRRARRLIVAAGAASVLTLVTTVVAGRLTGISTGILLPILTRFVAGCGGSLIANRGGPGVRRSD